GQDELPGGETPVEAYAVTEADIGDGITRNDIKDIHVNIPEAYVDEGSATISLSNTLISQFAEMRPNKTVVLNVDGSAVQLTVGNFQ
ncbi:hypothetical protein R0K17_25880, partial [Planococcus sp. SIMBA_143]